MCLISDYHRRKGVVITLPSTEASPISKRVGVLVAMTASKSGFVHVEDTEKL